MDLEPPHMTRVVQKIIFFCILLTHQLTARDSRSCYLNLTVTPIVGVNDPVLALSSLSSTFFFSFFSLGMMRSFFVLRMVEQFCVLKMIERFCPQIFKWFCPPNDISRALSSVCLNLNCYTWSEPTVTRCFHILDRLTQP